MRTGRECGRNSLFASTRHGIDLFVDETGSTTVAAAVAILVSLALLFSLATSQWVSARSADVQAVADAGALAGMNVVAGYATAAQVLDALVLSLGLIGMVTLAIGLVLSAIPVVDALGPPVMSAAFTVFEARGTLAKTAAKGLEAIEEVLPYAVAANSFLTVRSNASDAGSFVGVAIPFPSEGSSDFGQLFDGDVEGEARKTQQSGETVDSLSKSAAQAKERADDALLKGWSYDCATQPCMRERASTLAGLPHGENPDYPSVVGWDFGVAIRRAHAYYRARYLQEAPLDDSVEELTRSCARKAFYEYARDTVGKSFFAMTEEGWAVCDLRDLPANTDEVRGTTLYTDAVWPCTDEDGQRYIHCSLACPGATGSFSGFVSVADEESGACSECPVCRFTVVDLGRAPAASTSIDNGFEYYWRLVVEASREFESARNEQAEFEQRAQSASEEAVDGFELALSRLKANRVTLRPPGMYGCVCIVADGSSHASPGELVTTFSAGAELPPRAALSAAVLARDHASHGNTVLGDFFDGIVARAGPSPGASAVLDAVMGAWGDLLVSYGDGYDAVMDAARTTFRNLTDVGLGGLADWLRGALESALDLTGLAPADLSAKKPVLTNTFNVMEASGNQWAMAARSFVYSVQGLDENASLSQILGATGAFFESYQGSSKVTVAELNVPGTSIVIPIEIDFAWLAEVTA